VTTRVWEDKLVARLMELNDPSSPDRAAMSHLRRGLDKPLDYTLGRLGWLFAGVPESFEDLDLRSAVCVAGLFAWIKGASWQERGITFGAAFGADLGQDEKARRERRFIDLLDTDAAELPIKLRQAMTLIARTGFGLDWGLLIRQLQKWSDPERRVQQQWARGFWAFTGQSDTEN
jgi:CRISPR type I-E-associated protein CasB/Cse2